jgi:hypothetical protein
MYGPINGTFKKNHCFTTYLFILSIIYFFYLYFVTQILGFTNPTPLTKNLVLEICKKKGYIRIGSYFSFYSIIDSEI